MQPVVPATRANIIRKTVAVAMSRCLLEPSIMFVFHFVCCIDRDYWATDLISTILKELFSM